MLICPVTLLPAVEHDHSGDWATRRITVNGVDRSYIDLEGWPALIGSVYLPSTVVPVGLTASGLPDRNADRRAVHARQNLAQGGGAGGRYMWRILTAPDYPLVRPQPPIGVPNS